MLVAAAAAVGRRVSGGGLDGSVGRLSLPLRAGREVGCHMGMGKVFVARGDVTKKRGGDRVSRRKVSPSCSAPLVRPLAYTKVEEACFVARVRNSSSAVTTYLSSWDAIEITISMQWFLGDLYPSSSQTIALLSPLQQTLRQGGGGQGVARTEQDYSSTMVDTSNTAFEITGNGTVLCLCLLSQTHSDAHGGQRDFSPRKSQSQ